MEEHPTLLALGGSFLSGTARSWGGRGSVEGLIVRDGPSKYRLQLNHLGGLFWVRLPQSCTLSLAHTGTKKHVVTHRHGTPGHTDTGVPIQRGSLHTQTLGDAPPHQTQRLGLRAQGHARGCRLWGTHGHTITHHETQASPPPSRPMAKSAWHMHAMTLSETR